MLQMASSGSILAHFGPRPPRKLQMASFLDHFWTQGHPDAPKFQIVNSRMHSFGTILKRFSTWAAQTLQTISFSTVWDLGPKATQKLLIASSGTILDHFGPWTTQTLQTISVGTIFDHFWPEATQQLQFWCYIFGPEAVQTLQTISVGTILDHFGPISWITISCNPIIYMGGLDDGVSPGSLEGSSPRLRAVGNLT